MNNSVFVRTMENFEKRVDAKLVMDEEKLMKLTSKPTFVTIKIFGGGGGGLGCHSLWSVLGCHDMILKKAP